MSDYEPVGVHKTTSLLPPRVMEALARLFTPADDNYNREESDARFEAKGTAYPKAVSDDRYEAKGTSFTKAEMTAKLAEKIDRDEIDDFVNDDNVIDIATRIANGERVERGLFNYLGRGIDDYLQDTRVVFAGSSTSQGMSTTGWQAAAGVPSDNMGVFQRLANMSGASSIADGTAVGGPVQAAGMRWYQFVGSASGDYLAGNRINNIRNIAPHYVFHMIGSNDWATNVSLDQYRTNMQNTLNAIEGNVANVVNVLIHQQPRLDGSRAIPWSEYGRILRELAESNERRVFIDLETAFRPFGIIGGNRGGIVTPDNIHMGNVGHRFAFDVIARRVGIPTPADLVTGEDMRHMSIYASGVKPNLELFGQLPIEAANYPRLATVTGAIFARGPAGAELYNIFMAPGRNEIGTYAQRLGVENTDRSYAINNQFIIPAYQAGTIVYRVNGDGVYTSGTPGYTFGRVSLTPA